MSVVLKAEKREELGSSAARRIRRSGRIPAIIYSTEGTLNLSVNVKEFESYYFKGSALASVFELELDNKKIKVVPHKIDLHPVSDRPVHIDFFSVEEKKPIRAKPKLAFINQDKSIGLKKGGFLNIVLRRVEVICENEQAIPEKIEVDATSLQVGQKFRANDLILPENVKLLKKENFLIASITGRGKAEEEAAPTAATTGTTASKTATPAKTEEKKTDKKSDKK